METTVHGHVERLTQVANAENVNVYVTNNYTFSDGLRDGIAQVQLHAEAATSSAVIQLIDRVEEKRGILSAPEGGMWEIEDLRTHLGEVGILAEPTPISVKGTLCPSQLLYNGWWERKEEALKRKIVFKDGLQEWLFKGFEMWGPSWDLTCPTEKNPDPYLIAQIGVGDEVESLPVIVSPKKAKLVREEYLVGEGGKPLFVYEAAVSGILWHRSHLSNPKHFSEDKSERQNLPN